MTTFNYKEEDPEGLLTLEAIRDADQFNRWMYDQAAPWMQGEILEIGSGIGNLSEYFIRDKAKITLSDIRENYCNLLESRFPEYVANHPVRKIDLVAPDFKKCFPEYLEKFDSAFALNVVEHIEEDKLALQNLFSILKPGGKLMILVPAHPFLYNRIDTSLQHYKRYTNISLEEAISSAGFKVNRTYGFNAMGMPAWWLSGVLFRSSQIKNDQMNLYNKLIPLAKVIDKLVFNKFGLSVITLATKP